ncbi:formate/nitrite transporter family protein [Paractinoplanes atraurantiacus]|uniref:Formate/nitrite transporter n=1 Tax=Paractinoplanes atraurantiacus TaxID=1036182 RepID=A0A285GK52_9ACTN|nr:formate/nitrite transporter family protein [Actinoplanes atraurantiacus]SNY23584.1 Formate/nitrite transporter [Actinoplanes atraurantiacus]
MFVAYFLAVQSGVIGDVGTGAGTSGGMAYERLAGIAEAKGMHESNWQIFLRAVGCNWLVCLAVWMSLAADTLSGKILVIFFPIMAFVAMGFDHVVASMFFLPAAIFAGVPGLGWDDTLRNWLLAGAVIFVATSYWYMYLRDDSK